MVKSFPSNKKTTRGAIRGIIQAKVLDSICRKMPENKCRFLPESTCRLQKVADFFKVSLDYLVKGVGQAPSDDDFLNRYNKLSQIDKKKMIEFMNIFFPETA